MANIVSEIKIENHFGVANHCIKANTRNDYYGSYISIIKEISFILYPDKEFELYFQVPEDGSYKDLIKFIEKNKITLLGSAVIAVSTVFFNYLNYKDSHEQYLYDKGMRIVDTATKCLELKNKLNELGENYTIEGIDDLMLDQVCKSISLQKKKNNLYQALVDDESIENSKIIIKDNNGSVINSSNIEKNDFTSYINPIADEDYTIENVNGLIELNSPVFKQKKDGRGIPWRGTYIGENIIYKDFPVLNNNEDIDFYMQDNDFKSLVVKGERTFIIGDNMRVIFDIKGQIINGIYQNRSIYIKQVAGYNEDIIQHKANNKESIKTNEEQKGLFE